MISYFIVLRLDVLVLYLNRAFTNTNNLISRQKAWINGIALFRENTEDVYAGKELENSSEDVEKLNNFLKQEFGWDIRIDSGIGIKPISQTASERLIRAAMIKKMLL